MTYGKQRRMSHSLVRQNMLDFSLMQNVPNKMPHLIQFFSVYNHTP